MALTPEAYLVQWIDALRRREWIRDPVKYSILAGSASPDWMIVPLGYSGAIRLLEASRSDYTRENAGLRASARVL